MLSFFKNLIKKHKAGLEEKQFHDEIITQGAQINSKSKIDIIKYIFSKNM
jgi:hypothetical protein